MDRNDLAIPRLSEEALLFLLRRGDDPVDLAALDAWQGDFGPAVMRAALSWGVPPISVLRWSSPQV